MIDQLLKQLDHLTPLEASLLISINGLTAAVVALFFWFRLSYKRIEGKLNERDIERGKLFDRIAKLEKHTGIVDAVSACPVDDCPYRGAAQLATA